MGESEHVTITALARHENGEFVFAGLHHDILVYREKTREVEFIPSAVLHGLQ